MNFAPAQSTRVTLVAAVLGAVALFCAGMNEASAQADRTWTGGGNGLWSDNLDWAGGLQLRSLGDYSVLFSGTSRTTNTNDIGSVSISTMSFTNNGSAGQNAVFTISGSSLNLTNATITTTATSGGNALAGYGDTIANSLTLAGSNSVLLGAGHSISLTSGGVSGSGSISYGATGGNPYVYLTGNNTYSGNTYITGGSVYTAASPDAVGYNSAALGTGSVTISGSGSLFVRNNSSFSNNFTIGGQGASSNGTPLGALRGSFGTAGQIAAVSGSLSLSSDALITTAAVASATGSKLLLSGPTNLGSYTLTLAPSVVNTGTAVVPIELTGNVSGAGAIVVNGSSASYVRINGANSYSGGTTINSGNLLVGSAIALGSGGVAVNGGSLDLNGQSLSVGLLSGSSSGLIRSSVAGAASLTTTSQSSATYAGSIVDGTGVVSLTKAGGGTLFMTGSNGYTGVTYITGGKIQTGSNQIDATFNNNAFGTGRVVVSGSGALAVRNSSTVSNNLTISGSGNAGCGAIRGSFGASGQTAVVSGSVTLAGNASIVTAASSGFIGDKLVLSGPVNLASNILTLTPNVVASGTAPVPIELTGRVFGSGSVVVAGNWLSSVLMSGSSDYTGGTIISSGTLVTGSRSALGTGSLAVNGGVLDLNGQALAIGLLSGSSSGLIRSSLAGVASLTANAQGNATFAGSIVNGAGLVGVTKQGGGTLFMTGSNGYSGTTYITDGKIQTGSNQIDATFNNNALGTGNVVVSGNGTLAVRNSSMVSNQMTISGSGYAGGGAIRGSFGASGQSAVVSGSLSLAGNASIVTAASSGLTDNKLVLSGPVNLGSYSLTFTPGASSGLARFSDSAAAPIVMTGTMVGSGDVIVNGISAVYINGVNSSTGVTTVRSGALGGNGSIAGLVTVENGATLTPGRAANTTGSLGVGSLLLNAGATAEMMISGTATGLYDQVAAASSVTYGGGLAIDFTTAGFANFDAWQLFSGASHGGHLSSVSAFGAYGNLTFNYLGTGEWKATGGLLADGQSLSFYEDNSHVIGSRYQAGQLVLVPEPSTIIIAGIGMLIIGYRSWGKRRTAQRCLCNTYYRIALYNS